jgi:taurine---2-oxoglutarate transaminase
MTMNHAEMVARNKKYTLASWTAQDAWNPISMSRAEGVYFWDADGKRYIDWSSQLVNVNIGHSHPHVLKAIQDQLPSICYAYPGIATEPRARLGELLHKITPHDLSKSFFTTGGADAIENAMKLARMVTGRQKILSRYRSYHGATFGAMTAGGDPRRLANEPGVPWIVHVHDPYPYRSPLYTGRTQEQGEQALVELIEQTIHFEGPENIAGILLEGYSGTSGIMQGGEVFWHGIQALCDRYDILLIIDEVMSGFGRTGRWFGVDHYPWVKPDLMVIAKGLTSGYIPMGAVIATDEVASYFDKNVLWGGLTYSAHTLACAAAIANIEVYQNEGLIENAEKMGRVLRAGLVDLAERHNSIGDIRGTGLLQVIELVKNRATREPINGWNQPSSEANRRLSAALREMGMNTFVRWDWVFSAPPLVVTEEQIGEGLAIIDQALDIVDGYYEG